MITHTHLWTVLLTLTATDIFINTNLTRSTTADTMRSTTRSPSWLDSALGRSKQGVFTADFEGENNTVVELEDGDNILLDCKVFLRKEKTISWLRHTGVTGSVPDLLTVGNTTYTGDTRIRASFTYPNNWRLEIRDVQRKDSGVYVCQISTHPPMGLHTYLQVKDAVIEMVGEESDPSSSEDLPPDKFYNPGSDISLKCIIRRHLIKNATVQDITNVSWKKAGVLIDLQTQERISMGVEVSGFLVSSTLLVSHAVLSDAGQYSCTLPLFSNKEFPRAQAYVHVIYGDHAAVQGGALPRYYYSRWLVVWVSVVMNLSPKQ